MQSSQNQNESKAKSKTKVESIQKSIAKNKNSQITQGSYSSFSIRQKLAIIKNQNTEKKGLKIKTRSDQCSVNTDMLEKKPYKDDTESQNEAIDLNGQNLAEGCAQDTKKIQDKATLIESISNNKPVGPLPTNYAKRPSRPSTPLLDQHEKEDLEKFGFSLDSKTVKDTLNLLGRNFIIAFLFNMFIDIDLI